MEPIKIKIGAGLDELEKGRQQLVKDLRDVWRAAQQNPSADIPLIQFQFGNMHESWFRLSKSATNEPQIGYANSDHRAILGPLKRAVDEFLTENCQPQALRPLDLEEHFYDIDKDFRLAFSMNGESYPPESPQHRLAIEDPSKLLKKPMLVIPAVPVPAEKGAGLFGFFHHPEKTSIPQPDVAPEPKAKNRERPS